MSLIRRWRDLLRRRTAVAASPQSEVTQPPPVPPRWATEATAEYRPRIMTLGQRTGYRVRDRRGPA
ncbi:hypothetical protein [Micromonospora sp. NPDC004704]